jgi:hypothetical protein
MLFTKSRETHEPALLRYIFESHMHKSFTKMILKEDGLTL